MKHRARKRFGQNFLIDAPTLARIVGAISPREGEVVIEIGPGRAALTRLLVESGARVVAIEIDRDLAGRLPAELGFPGNLEVHCRDALEADLAALAGARRYRLVGNLPYNISSPILFHILQQEPPPQDIHVMLQREVVTRIVAEPGGKAYGRLSVMVQNLCQAVPLFEIPPDCFEPRPKVDSTLLRLTPRPSPLGDSSPETLDRVVRAAFAQRRKTLRNSLAGLIDEKGIQAAGIDPGLRAEQLHIAQFDRLAHQLDGE